MGRLVVVMAVVMAVALRPTEANIFSAFFAGSSTSDLCKVCQCPDLVTEARDHGADCRDANLTELEGYAIPKPYQKVDFSKNHIEEIKSSSFVETKDVLSLDFSANRIYLVEEEAFKKFPALQRLSLSNNKLTIIHNKTFEGLVRLTHLDLSYNQLSSLPSVVLQPLRSVEVLSLAFNQHISLKTIPTLRNLTTLDLSGIGLTSLHQDFFSQNLTHLEELSLAYNKLASVPDKGLFPLGGSLITLDLSANPIEALGAYSFYGLVQVRTLVLNQMLQLRTIEDYAFGNLRRLQKIQLTYMPRISSLSGKAFHTSGADQAVIVVEDFTFSFSILQTLPESLLPWDELRYVTLRYNHWSCDCNMRWIKNSSLLPMVGDALVCSLPERLRGMRVTKLMESDMTCDVKSLSEHPTLGFMLLLMVGGLLVSIGTVALLVYMKRGWLFVQPPHPYSQVKTTATTITVADELEWDNKDLEEDSTA